MEFILISNCFSLYSTRLLRIILVDYLNTLPVLSMQIPKKDFFVDFCIFFSLLLFLQMTNWGDLIISGSSRTGESEEGES